MYYIHLFLIFQNCIYRKIVIKDESSKSTNHRVIRFKLQKYFFIHQHYLFVFRSGRLAGIFEGEAEFPNELGVPLRQLEDGVDEDRLAGRRVSQQVSVRAALAVEQLKANGDSVVDGSGKAGIRRR